MKSSSSSSSFSKISCNNSQNATAGCLSGVLRRLLCIGSLPTHPSDHIQTTHQLEFDQNYVSKPKEKIEALAAPGIVARLMGLESMPDINLVRTPNSFTRSRSVNYTDDYWSEFDPTQGRHRRVRTSLSFREAPTFLPVEYGNFFFLSFDNVEEIGSKGKKLEMGFGEEKQRKTERSKNMENRREKVEESKSKSKIKKMEVEVRKKKVCNEKKNPRRKTGTCREIKDLGTVTQKKKEVQRKPIVAPKVDNVKKPTNQKKIYNGMTKVTTKKKKIKPVGKKVELDCNLLENSIPVSVLDVEADSRRKLSSPDLANCDHPTRDFTCNSFPDERESRSVNLERTESKITGSGSREYRESWREIPNLAEDEMNIESNWMPRRSFKFEDVEDFGIDFGLQVLDLLVHEIVYEMTKVV